MTVYLDLALVDTAQKLYNAGERYLLCQLFGNVCLHKGQLPSSEV